VSICQAIVAILRATATAATCDPLAMTVAHAARARVAVR
jgi:hypothetical protein